MISRRTVLFAAGAFGLSFAGIPAAQAADSRLLEDLLYGVSDALIRDYIRKHYEDGHYDGRRWKKDGKRYSPYEYRNHLIEQYRREEFERRAPKRPEPQKHQPAHRPPEPPRHTQDHRPPQPQKHGQPPKPDHQPESPRHDGRYDPRHDGRRPPMPR